MAGVGSFTDVALLNMPTLAGGDKGKYKNIMKPIDPLRYVKDATLLPVSTNLAFRMYFSQAEIPGGIMKRVAFRGPFNGIMRTIMV